MRRSISIVVLVAASLLPQLAAERRQTPRRVYIGTVVQGFDGDRFRNLLALELERAGFVVTDRKDEAEAVVTGEQSVWAEGGGGFSVSLTNSAGERLWQGSVPNPMRLRKTHCDDRDRLTALAQNVATAVRKALR